jgi:hypothetical protein
MPSNSPLWLAIAVLVITNLVSLWQVIVANRARKDAVATAEQARLTVEASAKRTEFGLRVRWATEQALSADPGKQLLGIAVLYQLERDVELSPGDRILARTAYRVAVAPPLSTWETVIRAGEPAMFDRADERKEDQR